jgi:hypothetical protein
MSQLQAFVVSLVACGVVGVVAPGSARAQAVAVPAAGPKMWVGGQVGVSPIGTLKGESPGVSLSADTATAFEVGGRFEYQVTPLLSIGIAPAFRFNIKVKDKVKDADESASQLDVPLRIAVGGEVASAIRVYGFATPGYTFLFATKDERGNSYNASGFMIGIGGGVGYRVGPKFMLSGELGYQFRFPSTTVQGVDTSYQDNYLTFTVGAAAGF